MTFTLKPAAAFAKIGGLGARKIGVMSLLMFLSLSAYSLELENNLSLGYLGFSVSSENESIGYYFFGYFVNFHYQTTSGFGVTASPLHFFSSIEEPMAFSLTFVNASLFYNFFRDEQLILGPFGSINAVKHNRPDFFEVHGGVRFSLRNIDPFNTGFFKNSIFGLDFLVAELGYKYNNEGQHSFYAYIGMDLLSMLFIQAGGTKYDEYENYQKEHPVY